MGRHQRIASAVLVAAASLVIPAAAAALPFTPQLTATLGTADQPAHVGGHPQFTTVVTQPDNQERIKKAVVTLPAGLFANVNALSTLCTPDQASVFACPTASQVGTAKAVSPWLPTPLTGGVFIAENPTGGLPGLFIGLGATGPVVSLSGIAAGALPARLPLLIPTREMRRMTRPLAHEGQATASWGPTSFSNSTPHSPQRYS